MVTDRTRRTLHDMVSKKSISVWGPATWLSLHVMAHTAPLRLSDVQRNEARTLLRSIAAHLPCPRCREHFSDFLDRRMNDESLATRASFVSLLNDAHNEVNMRRGKRIWTLAEHYRAYQTPSNVDAVFDAGSFAMGILCVILVVCFLTRRQRKIKLARCQKK